MFFVVFGLKWCFLGGYLSEFLSSCFSISSLPSLSQPSSSIRSKIFSTFTHTSPAYLTPPQKKLHYPSKMSISPGRIALTIVLVTMAVYIGFSKSAEIAKLLSEIKLKLAEMKEPEKRTKKEFTHKLEDPALEERFDHIVQQMNNMKWDQSKVLRNQVQIRSNQLKILKLLEVGNSKLSSRTTTTTRGGNDPTMTSSFVDALLNTEF